MIRVTDAQSPTEAYIALLDNFDIVVLDWKKLKTLICLTKDAECMAAILIAKPDWEFTGEPLPRLKDAQHIKTPHKKINEVIASLQKIFPELSFENGPECQS